MDRFATGPLDWTNEVLLGLLASSIFIAHCLVLIFPPVRAFLKTYTARLAEASPDIGQASTLLGLVLVIVAILVSRQTNSESLLAFEGVLLLLSAAALYVFLHLLLSREVIWWAVHFSGAALLSSWWCLGWALFALINGLLTGQGWPFAILLAPAIVFFAALSSLYPMLKRN